MDENSKLYKLKMFINECKRVLRVTKRPDSFEFKTIVKVSGIGMGLIGLIGFLVSMLKNLMSGGV
jgi:protein transport protein SEC61 subunit gamma-like protein